MFFRYVRFFAFVTVSLLLFVSCLHASPRMNYPGTRARAMGSAFTAIADDASAVWYNPAGINSEGEQVDIIIEGNEAIDDDLDIDTTPFLSLKMMGEKWGFAFSYFNPYVFGSPVVITEEDGYVDSWNEGITVNRLDIFSVGAARKLANRIKVGGTVEFVDVDTKEDLEYPSDSKGFSGSIGVQWIPVEDLARGFRVRVGGTYRFKSSIGDSFEKYSKPSSWNCGAAVMKSVTSLCSNLIVSAQYEKTDFTEIGANGLKYEMMSYGAEWQIALDSSISRIAFRAGLYSESPEVGNDFEMNGATWGIGVRFGEKLGVEYSMEKREWQARQAGYKDEFTLHALALTYSYHNE